MSNLEKYTNVFVEAFGISSIEAQELTYQDAQEWDSVAHMQMITLLESTFNIELDIDDILNYQSFKNGIQILKRYGVEI